MFNIFSISVINIRDAAQELATNPDNLLLFTSLVVTTVFVAQVESCLLGTVLFVGANLFVIIN